MIAEIFLFTIDRSVNPSLQWGRDQMIAEMFHLAPVSARQILLQWGRDQMIAEMPADGAKYCPTPGFNGAAIK